MKITLSRMLLLMLLTGVLHCAVATPIQAKDPVPRFFATSGLPCIDWEAESSIGIAAHRDRELQGLIEFITPRGGYSDDDAIVRDAEGKVLIDLRSTRWVQIPVVLRR